MRNLITALAVLFALPAAAQQCAPRDVVVAALTGSHGETPRVVMLAANGTVI